MGTKTTKAPKQCFEAFCGPDGITDESSLRYTLSGSIFLTRDINEKSPSDVLELFCGPDGTRTRDPMRDRHVF